MSIQKEQITAVKARVFLLNRGTENFSWRIVSPGGVFTAEQPAVVAECTRRFGSGTVAISSRQSPELVGTCPSGWRASHGRVYPQGIP